MTDRVPPTTLDLIEIEAIKQLKSRYCRLMDTKKWDEWALVFATDCVLDLPAAGVTYHGRREIVDNISSALATVQTVHHGHMPEIQLTGPDTARGVWAMFDHVEWERDEHGERVGHQGYGHYHEEYVRENGQWRVARIRLERLRMDQLSNGGPAAARANPADPSLR